MAQFPDRHFSERKAVGLAKSLKPIDGIDYLAGECGSSRFGRLDGTASRVLKQAGGVIANSHSMLRGLTSEFFLKLRREFNRYSHRLNLLLHQRCRPSEQQTQPSYARRNRKLFITTETLDSAMAADAIMGESVQLVHGYSTPAASGIPIAL